MSLFGYGSTNSSATPRPSESRHNSTSETPLLANSSDGGHVPSPQHHQQGHSSDNNLPTITATGDVSQEVHEQTSNDHEGGWFSFFSHRPSSADAAASSHQPASKSAGSADLEEQNKQNKEMKLAQEHKHTNHQHDNVAHATTSCELPKGMQTLVAPEHHAMLEQVVVTVRDSADVTQKTIFYFWDEWKNFINRGNVVDLGIGIVIGGAFTGLIDSLVADILTPPLSLWAMGTNLENSFIVLRHGRTPGMKYTTVEEAQADGAVTENTGHFLKACINFLFIAFCLFWVMKAMHNIRKEKIRPPPKVKTCNWCRESIALDAFRCRYCQSYVKDIPGLEDCGVGMFVKIKKPKPANTTTNATTTVATGVDGSAQAGGAPVPVANGNTDGGSGGGEADKTTDHHHPDPSLSRSGSFENAADAQSASAAGATARGSLEEKPNAGHI
ncbi:hypothetical protein BGW42_006500 [Actinomortierella wolfii]|nr:hypothetical protein BGW42_006500 [Actinomortierella wolfii]